MPDPNATAERDTEQPDPVTEAVETTEAYQTEEGVVFYDADNPLAWMQAADVVDLDEAA